MRSNNGEPIGSLIAAILLVCGLMIVASVGPAEPAGQPAGESSQLPLLYVLTYTKG